MSSDTLTFRYTFRFPEGEERVVEATLDFATLGLRSMTRGELPEWTALAFEVCPNCPLPRTPGARCPAAVAVLPAVEAFSDVKSYQGVTVTVEAPGRTYVKETTAQAGISALLGLLMATSGCPVLERLRPMVETHLPFVTPEESSFRMIASYLVGQLIRARHGLEPDWDLSGLPRFFQELQVVNTAFCRRLNTLRAEDASVNAVVILNTLGNMVGFSLAEGDLERLDRLFRSHVAAGPEPTP